MRQIPLPVAAPPDRGEAATITPVLLCGGSGTRLWPLSRRSFPKQFAPLLGGESLFQAALRRFRGPGFGAPLIVTGHGTLAPAALFGMLLIVGGAVIGARVMPPSSG